MYSVREPDHGVVLVLAELAERGSEPRDVSSGGPTRSATMRRRGGLHICTSTHASHASANEIWCPLRARSFFGYAARRLKLWADVPYRCIAPVVGFDHADIGLQETLAARPRAEAKDADL